MNKLPEQFLKRMKSQLPSGEFAEFIHALDSSPPVSVRLNPGKMKKKINAKPVPWCEWGYYLPYRPNFASDPHWHAGMYYVQEASSMMTGKAIAKARSLCGSSVRMLDLCAAPGGKSTLASNLLRTDDMIVCNEVIRPRTGVLTENVIKYGYPNVVISSNDSADFAKMGQVFDIILADVPCSGEGLFRKDPGAMQHWSDENIRTCELRQKRILQDIIRCLKPGGFIVYSTCTWNPGENEAQIEMLTAKGFELLEFDDEFAAGGIFQAYPHRLNGEGFFLALLRNTDGDHVNETTPAGKTYDRKDIQVSELIDDSGIEIRQLQDKTKAASFATFTFMEKYGSRLRTLQWGCDVSVLQGKENVPSATLPFSMLFKRHALINTELERKDVLAYLNRQSLPCSSAQTAYTVISYKGLPVGLGKIVKTRINNLFPKEWMLRRIPPENEWFSLPEYE